MANSLLRLPQVAAKTGQSKSGIYLQIKNGLFPKPIAIGQRARAWLESDIEALIQAWMSDASAQEIRQLISARQANRKMDQAGGNHVVR